MHGNVIHDNIFAKHQEYITCFACHWVHCWFFRYPPQSIRYQSSHWWPSSHWSTIHIVFVEALVLFWFSLALDTLSQEVQRAVLQQSRFHICCITHQTEPEIWFEVKNFSSLYMVASKFSGIKLLWNTSFKYLIHSQSVISFYWRNSFRHWPFLKSTKAQYK